MIERFWKPPQVARALGITVSEARELMRCGEIPSDLYATTKNDREYYRTTRAAVEAYQRRRIRLRPDDTSARNYPLISVQ